MADKDSSQLALAQGQLKPVSTLAGSALGCGSPSTALLAVEVELHTASSARRRLVRASHAPLNILVAMLMRINIRATKQSGDCMATQQCTVASADQ